MFSKIVKYFGLVLIISFSAISVFFAIAEREIDRADLKKMFYYTSFFEDRFYDFRMRQSLDMTRVDKRLVMADIDDYSLKKLGQWPVTRHTWSHLVSKLNTFGAKVIAFDVFFGEETKVCGTDDPDGEFFDSIVNFQEKPGNKVILPYSLVTLYQADEDFYEEMPEHLYNYVMDAKQREGLNLIESKVSKSVYPIPKLLDSDAALGHIQVVADSDGIMRHYRLVGNIDTIYLPSYALSTYQHLTGDSTTLELLGLEKSELVTTKGRMQVNYKGESKVRWFGGPNQFPRVPIYDIISAGDNDEKMKSIFDGTAVFVGASAFGAYDLRHTPIDPILPGVYFHMNFTNMLLDGRFFKPHSESTLYSWSLLIIGTVLILLIQFFGNPILDLAGVILLSAGLYLFDTYFLTPEGYEIKLFFCLFSVMATYSWNTFLHFYLANKDKAFLKSAFGNYISPELIDEMYKNGEPPKLGGDSGVRTAFFTDIQGFSTFSEKLSATGLVELLNEYLTAMTDILLEENGTLDKYEGDAIIAFFGAPMPLPDHAARACMVAHRMQETLLELRKKWLSEGEKWPQIVHDMRMRIGINSGEIVTGNMGSTSRMNYTMMGDSVNLAARLEESAKQYGIFTQVSKETVELAGDDFLWRELDTIRVVGKSVPVTTFELLGLKTTGEPYLHELSKFFKAGIEYYKKQEWDMAIELFTKTLELEYQRFPELKGVKTNPSEIYLERCKEYKVNPPIPDWDGVYTLTSK
ncbi:CHASE2 domain protein [Bacteriovorax sp. BSW11_IV]|uniref:adenylate/guanylate cyclase domain-containing protein n=1 Tax=Bacteriovorax sp. BSW11_IV TaxID=1353529 RepID=UPI00038A4D7E|nr:adenylate/guanylate cyclase domain-containing protein [Bacteriovorax sp. BSW11_IV]EQC44070.1 CHASE2 domain protein [Bacteriovorax sp. BSW11_IV]